MTKRKLPELPGVYPAPPVRGWTWGWFTKFLSKALLTMTKEPEIRPCARMADNELAAVHPAHFHLNKWHYTWQWHCSKYEHGAALSSRSSRCHINYLNLQKISSSIPPRPYPVPEGLESALVLLIRAETRLWSQWKSEKRKTSRMNYFPSNLFFSNRWISRPHACLFLPCRSLIWLEIMAGEGSRVCAVNQLCKDCDHNTLFAMIANWQQYTILIAFLDELKLN